MPTNLPPLQLDPERIEALLRLGFPDGKGGGGKGIAVELVEPGRVRTRIAFRPSMLRPGNIVSGPALMLAADTAMYVAVLAHAGPAVMAVTSDMSLRYLNKALPGDMVAEARILKFGRRLVVMECSVETSGAPGVVALHSTGSYALPASAASS